MEQFFNNAIELATSAPLMMYVSFFAAVATIIGGILLYRNRKVVKNLRWPGATIAAIGCISVVTAAIQYAI